MTEYVVDMYEFSLARMFSDFTRKAGQLTRLPPAFDPNDPRPPHSGQTVGTSGDDVLRAGNFGDALYGHDGNDVLDGGPGPDYLDGGPGDDFIFPGLGSNTVIGGAGIDFVLYPTERLNPIIVNLREGWIHHNIFLSIDKITEVEGVVGTPLNDQIAGDDGFNILVGYLGNDTLWGLGGSDLLAGGEGNDTLFGGEGDDYLMGGAGNDALYGEAGIDVAVFNSVRNGNVVAYAGPNSQGSVSGPEGLDYLTGIEVLNFRDGKLVFDVESVPATVLRMYVATFQRGPDPVGLNSWITQLENGVGIDVMAEAFATSAEFQATYGALGNEDFVKLLYGNALGREGDQAGIAAWTNQLVTGAYTRGQVLAGFSESPEHKELLRAVVEQGIWDQNESAGAIARLYVAALERYPDAGGFVSWIDTFNAGMPLNDIADGFANAPEFHDKYGPLSNADYVEQLYLNTLGRPSDPAGKASWLQALDAGTQDRGDVLVGFSESLEHQLKTAYLIEDGTLLM